jgi:large subunit ribosomal protein L21
MYAIVSTGGKQYKVAEGDVIDVEKLDMQPGGKVDLDVLMLADGTKTIVDPQELAGQKVVASVVDQRKADKVLVFKLHKRKRYHRTRGHRQQLTRLKIESVPGSSETAAE